MGAGTRRGSPLRGSGPTRRHGTATIGTGAASTFKDRCWVQACWPAFCAAWTVHSDHRDMCGLRLKYHRVAGLHAVPQAAGLHAVLQAAGLHAVPHAWPLHLPAWIAALPLSG